MAKTISVSDELRNFAESGYYNWSDRYKDLYAIAARVDAEMVELPRDADGVPIHLGNTVFTKDDPETSWSVRYIELRCGREQSIGIESNGVNTYRPPSCLTRKRPDSLERIAEEMDVMASDCNHRDFVIVARDTVTEMTERIRRLAEREVSDGTD